MLYCYVLLYVVLFFKSLLFVCLLIGLLQTQNIFINGHKTSDVSLQLQAKGQRFTDWNRPQTDRSSGEQRSNGT